MAKLTYPKAPQGTQANLRSVKMGLPKQTAVAAHDPAEGMSR